MPIFAALMQKFVEQKSLENLNGTFETCVPGVKFYRASQSSQRQPLLYKSGIILMGQGHKNIYIADNCVQYGPGDYLVLGVPMPLECEAFSDNGQPILGLSIDIGSHTLHKLVSLIEKESSHLTAQDFNDKAMLDFGVKSDALDEKFNAAVLRLLESLQHDGEAKVLGPAIVEEIIYRVLIGRHGHVLFDLAHHDGHYARIARVLDILHKEYAQELPIEELADQAHMSLSSFHRAFRQVTSETPLQYLKKIRLNKAKDLIVAEGKQATQAAIMVGYSSPSQFSREFKRHFNATPKSMLNIS